MVLWKDRDGYWYVEDRDWTMLVTGWVKHPMPARMGWGLYVEEGLPGVVWLAGRRGLFRLDTVPASLLARFAPYRCLPLREGLAYEHPQFPSEGGV